MNLKLMDILNILLQACLLVMLTSCQQNHVTQEDSRNLISLTLNNREVASGTMEDKGCRELVKSVLKKTSIHTEHTNKPIKNVFNKIGHQLKLLKYKTRLQFIELLAKYHFFSSSSNRQLTDLLNYAHTNNLLTEDDLLKMTTKLDQFGMPPVVFSKGKFYPTLDDTLALEDEIIKLIELFPTEFRAKMTFEFIGDNLDKNKMQLNKRELDVLSRVSSQIKNADDIQRLLSYIGYVRTEKKNDYEAALLEISSLFAPEEEQAKFIRKFYQSQEKIEKSWGKFQKKYQKEPPNKILEMKSLHEKLFYSCNAKTSNGHKSVTNKRFFKTIMGIEAFIIPATYVTTHWEDEKDKEWYKKFIFEMFIKILPMTARSGMIAISGQSVAHKIIQDYSAMIVADISPSIAYSKAMSPSEKDLEKKLISIYNSPKFQEELKELISIYNDELEKGKLEKVLKNEDGNFKNYQELSNNDEAKELLLHALSVEMYKENQGDWIVTGDVGLDRYVFNRLWSLQGSVRTILVNLFIYDRLCMGELNPQSAYTEAVAAYSINRLIFEPGYQILRREAINQ